MSRCIVSMGHRYHSYSCHGCSTDSLPNMWTQDVWLTLIHSLIVARPEEDEVWDKIFPYQMHEVIRKQLGKLQGHKSTEKSDLLHVIHLCKLLSLYSCGRRLHCFGLCHKLIMGVQR